MSVFRLHEIRKQKDAFYVESPHAEKLGGSCPKLDTRQAALLCTSLSCHLQASVCQEKYRLRQNVLLNEYDLVENTCCTTQPATQCYDFAWHNIVEQFCKASAMTPAHEFY